MTNRRVSMITLLTCIFAGTGCSGQAGAPADGDEGAQTVDENVQTLSTAPGAPRPTIVLVHGAFADGTGWQKVIQLLQHDGYPVIAVQNTLTGIADDVATTKRAIDAAAAKGPVIAVGHSYGGVIITAAAVNPAVKALVYVNAFAPEAGEVLGDLSHRLGSGPLDTALVADSAGFLTVDPAKFRDVFCADVKAVEAAVAAAAQKPIASAAFAQSVAVTAWKDKPSWFLVGREDQAINPDLERFMAQRIGAHTQEIHSSHVPFISHPRVVTRLIEEAAHATR